MKLFALWLLSQALCILLPILPCMAIAHVLAHQASSAPTCGLSPTTLVATEDGKTLFIACATTSRVLRFDTASRNVLDSIPVPEAPSGLALSAGGARLFVTCAGPNSSVCIVDTRNGKIIQRISAGHTAMAPVLSPDGKTLCVCNRFDNDVSVIDLVARKELRRIGVWREPVAADVTKDGKRLLVANHLPAGRADAEYVAAVVSVADLVAGKVSKELLLPHGSGSLKELRVSPDGSWAVVTHVLARSDHPTTQAFRGWINVNALTIIDLASMTIRGTVLLDEPDKGAANPWGVAWSADNSKLLVTHAGTHEVSVINFTAMLAELSPPANAYAQADAKAGQARMSRQQALDSNYSLPFLVGARERVTLSSGDLGPRAVVAAGHTAYVANYFSDTLSAIDFRASQLRAESIPLGPKSEMDAVRKGEFYFHDARICYQSWQSCSSCHPGDARADGLNWDLLNDGTGNPKNTRSLLLAHKTPPAMSLGVRETAETAVRSGIRHILFTAQPETVAQAIDEYLKALKPVPSPHLVDGRLSESAERGKAVFGKAGCATCHPAGLFTDLRRYDVGTRTPLDKPTDMFDTPTLIELWRTAPYLHDGSAATVREVITTRNLDDQHGKTSVLTGQELNHLCEFLLSL